MTEPRHATADDLATVAAVLGDAFTDDPVMTWGFPDVATRPRLVEAMFGYLAEHVYLPQGQSAVTDDAASLWLPAGVTTGDEFWVEHGEAFVTAIEGQVDRLATLAAAMDEHHPSAPHRYLLALGVRPAAQGRGLGSDLLAHALAQADEQGEPAYLEATSPRSRALYARHGFEVVDEFSADGSPPLWAMWREPR
jgi:GNAT superfamily N-acetyltransferase